MNTFVETLLSKKTHFILKREKQVYHETREIKNQVSNLFVFKSVQFKFVLKYTLSRRNINNNVNCEYMDNCIIYLRDEQFYENYKEHNDFVSFTCNRIRKIKRKCKNYFIFPIAIQAINGGHLVFMLYTKENDTFYLFDSSGFLQSCEELHDDLFYLFPEFENVETCNELQAREYIETTEEEKGHCMSWAAFLIYCYVNFNRELASPIGLIEKVLTICDDKVKTKRLINNFSHYALNDFNMDTFPIEEEKSIPIPDKLDFPPLS